jgi:hypothetical protein
VQGELYKNGSFPYREAPEGFTQKRCSLTALCCTWEFEQRALRNANYFMLPLVEPLAWRRSVCYSTRLKIDEFGKSVLRMFTE